jgi:hypothetical protein
MASTVRGFALRAVEVGHGKPDKGIAQVSFGKAMAQTNTINLFTVTGSIVCSLVGVISTVFGAVAQHPTLGITGLPSAIAAAPAVALNAAAVGTVITVPQVLGAALPAPLTAGGAPSACVLMEVSNTVITLSSDASTTGNVTWVLSWVPLYPKQNASVATN